MALRDVRLISVAAGGCFSVAISDAGSVYAWGEGGPRAGFEADVLLPRRLSLARPLSDADQIIAAMAGHTHVLLRTANGKLLTWGSGGDGKLGHGTSEDKATPHAVAPPGRRGYHRRCGRHDELSRHWPGRQRLRLGIRLERGAVQSGGAATGQRYATRLRRSSRTYPVITVYA